ncbi:AEC family transporter [Desulfohalobium retbaense]|uniref:Auxin Efflux Carrier n=1 Tax=Desulfohalobium retbaense (strain ATCC 49708 / DSM 5692 / JCM 16813 / HR100) TaxID=485915 RepID=C8X1R0_DESRD|nr:AEC family transporter [Desulfohalobium retbaense]ACV68482.1 Auxin Efflux Carrier [Desulfohalobium retbaense DSM 5692]
MSLSILLTTFESVALLLGIGAFGLWIISRRILPQEALGTLSILALDISLPSLVFVNILKNFKPAEFPGWWLLPVWWAGFTLFQGALTAVLAWVSQQETRREFAVSLFFQNALFFPLAILMGMFGQDSTYIVQLFFFMLLFPSLLFSTAHLFFGISQQTFAWSKIFNKILLATILATTLRLTGTEGIVPGFVVSALGMIGDMTIPLLLMILGGNIYVDFKHKGSLYPVEVGKFVLIKNFLFPAIALGVLALIQPPYHIALLIILQASVPPITAIPILTERAGGNREIVNQFMFSSFAVSLVSIPLMIGLFGMIFHLPAP